MSETHLEDKISDLIESSNEFIRALNELEALTHGDLPELSNAAGTATIKLIDWQVKQLFKLRKLTEMNKFTLSIDIEGADFEDTLGARLEVGRILREVAKSVEGGDYYLGHTMGILNNNGDRIGSYKWQEVN